MLYNSQKNGVNENWVTRFQVELKSVLGVCGPMYGLYQKNNIFVSLGIQLISYRWERCDWSTFSNSYCWID